MRWGKTFLYKCFDAGTLQTAQADIEHGNELNMSNAKAVKQEKMKEDLSDPDLGYDSREEDSLEDSSKDSSDDRNQLEG